MKTITNNNYGCSSVEQEHCAQIHGGSTFVKAIGRFFGILGGSYANVYEHNPYAWDIPTSWR